MNQVKHIASLFFMAIFLFIKVSGCHALFHDTDEVEVQHCELCDITNAVNFTPVLLAETAQKLPSRYVAIILKEKVNCPLSVLFNNYTDNYRFTRPPPYLA